jgi:hypothetical protein
MINISFLHHSACKKPVSTDPRKPHAANEQKGNVDIQAMPKSAVKICPSPSRACPEHLANAQNSVFAIGLAMA